LNAKRSNGNSRDALSHFATDKFFEFDIPAFSTDEMPLLLKEEGAGEGDSVFVDEQLLSEKIEEWKKERKRGKVEEKIVFIGKSFCKQNALLKTTIGEKS
jgi:predicted RNase H-like nuclease (RuvC/YqgF family)